MEISRHGKLELDLLPKLEHVQLMNIINTRVRNSLTENHISDFMTAHSMGEELVDWEATPFISHGLIAIRGWPQMQGIGKNQ